MNAKLAITNAKRVGLEEGISIPIAADYFSVGRAPGNDWVLPDSTKTLSKRHFYIKNDENQYYIIDISSNGTYLNNHKKTIPHNQAVPINFGDVIYVGEYEILFSEMAHSQANLNSDLHRSEQLVNPVSFAVPKTDDHDTNDRMSSLNISPNDLDYELQDDYLGADKNSSNLWNLDEKNNHDKSMMDYVKNPTQDPIPRAPFESINSPKHDIYSDREIPIDASLTPKLSSNYLESVESSIEEKALKAFLNALNINDQHLPYKNIANLMQFYGNVLSEVFLWVFNQKIQETMQTMSEAGYLDYILLKSNNPNIHLLDIKNYLNKNIESKQTLQLMKANIQQVIFNTIEPSSLKTILEEELNATGDIWDAYCEKYPYLKNKIEKSINDVISNHENFIKS